MNRWYRRGAAWWVYLMGVGCAWASFPLGPVGGTGDYIAGSSLLKIVSLDETAPGYLGGLRVNDLVYGAFGDDFGETRTSSGFGYLGAVMDFGLAIERAESGDGTLPLQVLRPDAGGITVNVALPAAGAFGPAYPLGSTKFDDLYQACVDGIYARIDGNHTDGQNGGFYGLIVLSHPDWNTTYSSGLGKLLVNATNHITNMIKEPVENLQIDPPYAADPEYVGEGLANWRHATMVMFLAEYIAKSGETQYLPDLQRGADALANRIQTWRQPRDPGTGYVANTDGYRNGMMGHGAVGGDYIHLGWGGGMNIMNAYFMPALAMAKCAGADVDVDIGQYYVDKGYVASNYNIADKFEHSWNWVRKCTRTSGPDTGNIGYTYAQYGGGDSSGRTAGVLAGMKMWGFPGVDADLDMIAGYLSLRHYRQQHCHAFTVGGVVLYQFALPYLSDRTQRYIMENWRFYYNLARQPDGSAAYVGGRENNGGDGYLNTTRSGWMNYAMAQAVASGNLTCFPAPDTTRIYAELTSPWTTWPTEEAQAFRTTGGNVSLVMNVTDYQGTSLTPAQYTAQWSHLSGPATATFADPSLASTTVTFPQSGRYRIRFVGTQGGYAVTNDYDVVAALFTPPSGYLTGVVDYEIYTGLSSGGEVSELTGAAKYPNSPDVTGRLTAIDMAYNSSNYGTRIRGYIIPLATGNYTFYIASDDNSELWFNSAGPSEAGATLIASVTGHTGQYEWTKYSQQASSVISLTAGQPYFFEVLHKEGGGTDHVAVAWQGPGMSGPQVIDGEEIAVAAPATQVPVVTVQPADTSSTLGGSAVLEVDVDGYPPFVYTWQLDGTDYWGPQTSSSLNPTNLSAHQAGEYRVIIANAYGVVTSQVATLSITNAGGQFVSGGLWREVYTGIGGSDVSDLTSVAAFPRFPDAGGVIAIAEAPQNYSSNYGQRWSGWLKPSISANYRFFIASDDTSELWLSTDDDPDNLVKIAERTSYNSSRQWSTAGTSAYIPVVAGERYFIRVLQKEGGGADHCAVAWQREGTSQPADGTSPIPGSRLEYVVGGGGPPMMVPQTVNGGSLIYGQAFTTNLTARIVEPDAGDPVTFSKVSGPDWATVASDGTISGTPGTEHLGLNEIVVSVTDGRHGSTEATLQIAVGYDPADYTAWAATHGLAGSQSDDDDNDGWSNEAEFYGGSDPMDLASKITHDDVAAQAGGEILLSWDSVQDGTTGPRGYDIHTLDGAYHPGGVWQRIAGPVSAQGVSSIFTDQVSQVQGLRLYAVMPAGYTGGPVEDLLGVQRITLEEGRQNFVAFPVDPGSNLMADLFPDAQLTGGGTETEATCVDLWDPATESFATRYWLSSNGLHPGWRESGGVVDANSVAVDLSKGAVVILRNGMGSQDFLLTGALWQAGSYPTTAEPNYNLLSYRFPYRTLIPDSGLVAAGFQGGTDSYPRDDQQDLVILLNPVNNTWDSIHWYHAASATWYSGNSPSTGVFEPGQPFLILRQPAHGNLNWTPVRPYTLPLEGP